MRNLFAMIGCATVVVATAIAVWFFRGEIRDAYESVRARTASVGTSVEGDRGYPSARALQAAEVKESAIADPRGPAYVVLSADEMASLIADRLVPAVRSALDSLSVALGADRVTLRGNMRLDAVGRDLLGPLTDLLGSTQPIVAAGPIEVLAPGALSWQVDEFVIREFAFPAAAVGPLVNRLSGDSTGAFTLNVPETIVDARVRSDGITFYRRVP